MTLDELYRLPKSTLATMRDALDAEMRSPDWSDTDKVNGMLMLDWAEHICVAYECAT